MSWSLGDDRNTDRFIGYGVVAFCDHPGCHNTIDRGLAYVCGGDLYGGADGCGLFFCGEHMFLSKTTAQTCIRCAEGMHPFKPKKYEHPVWIKHVLKHPSWAHWREENPKKVLAYSKMLKTIKYRRVHNQLNVKVPKFLEGIE